jgi:putative acetyltransferase
MITVRELRIGDEPALRAVFESAIHEVAIRGYTPLQVDTWAPQEYDAVAWATRVQGLQPFVALLEDRIAGYADVQANGYVDQFYVAARAGGQGVGGALMRRILARAGELGLAELSSHVSLTAQPFFAHFGFIVTEHRVVNVRGVEMRNAAMKKLLTTA